MFSGSQLIKYGPIIGVGLVVAYALRHVFESTFAAVMPFVS